MVRKLGWGSGNQMGKGAKREDGRGRRWGHCGHQECPTPNPSPPCTWASHLATAPNSPSTCTTFFRPRCAAVGAASSRTPQAAAQSAPGPRTARAHTWGHRALSPNSWPLPFRGLAPRPSFSAARTSHVPRPPPWLGSQGTPPKRLADPASPFLSWDLTPALLRRADAPGLTLT